MPPSDPTHEGPLFCHRCAAVLRPGHGELYRVKIEAMADPFPPELLAEEMAGDLEAQIGDLIHQAGQRSEQELLDQVHRRMVLFLCASCYAAWIEAPTG